MRKKWMRFHGKSVQFHLYNTVRTVARTGSKALPRVVYDRGVGRTSNNAIRMYKDADWVRLSAIECMY